MNASVTQYKWSNGQIRSQYTRLDGTLHGMCQTWYYDGSIQSQGFYHNHKLHGELKSWDLHGNLSSHELYCNGSRVVDFLKNPALYPKTEEERTAFTLKYSAPLHLNQ